MSIATDKILVKDAMRKKVFTTTVDESVLDVAIKLKNNGVGSLVVMDGEKPIGIITREDISDKVAAQDKKASEVKVKDVMNQPLISCSSNDDINSVSKIMVKYGYRRIPVIDNGKLVGIISAKEILKISPVLVDVFKEYLERKYSPDKEESMEGGTCEMCDNYSESLTNVNDKWICEACKEESE